MTWTRRARADLATHWARAYAERAGIPSRLTALLLEAFVVAGAIALGYGTEIGEAPIITMVVGIIAAVTTTAATLLDPASMPTPTA